MYHKHTPPAQVTPPEQLLHGIAAEGIAEVTGICAECWKIVPRESVAK